MSAKRRRYEPGVAGTRTVALTVAVPAGATSAGSGLRTPSHTAVLPAASYQWYASAIWPAAGEACGEAKLFHVSSPALVTTTLTSASEAAPIEAGGVAW